MSTRENRLLSSLTHFLKDRFNLDTDQADEKETIEYIRKGVEFKGTNLWILIFAIFIASIGLNVNSPAVIIGAMLISPLMGPILGIGVSVATFDIEMLNRSYKNFAMATVISILTSTLYFSISPLSDARAELLARTTPTIWDVLIAFFGGLAGIVAGSRKEKSNAIPGVAIATALMPPLCTAGYGLATGNLYYFLGAFYLYFINSVFITLATFVIVRFLKYPRKEFVDSATERRVKTIMMAVTIVTIIPSIYLGYNVVRHSIFERNASLFINQELQFSHARVINRNIVMDGEKPTIEVTLFGEPVAEEMLENARLKLKNYNLEEAELIVFQGYEDKNMDEHSIQTAIRSGVVEELYRINAELLQSKDDKIRLLENEIIKLRQTAATATEIAPEIKALNPQVREFCIQRTLLTKMDSLTSDTVHLAFMKFARRPPRSELNKLESWIKARLKTSRVVIVAQ